MFSTRSGVRFAAMRKNMHADPGGQGYRCREQVRCKCAGWRKHPPPEGEGEGALAWKSLTVAQDCLSAPDGHRQHGNLRRGGGSKAAKV